MNLELVKNEIKEKLCKKVEIKVYGSRNKVDTIVGIITSVYPNIFTVISNGENKSFSYADVITGEIKLKYL